MNEGHVLLMMLLIASSGDPSHGCGLWSVQHTMLARVLLFLHVSRPLQVVHSIGIR